MDKKSILNHGVGSPGESARVMTKEFIRLKEEKGFNNEDSCFLVLSNRAEVYNSMISNILDDYLVRQIASKSKGRLPFMILADIFITNKAQGKNHIWALLEHLDDVIEVVFENYNSLVGMTEKSSPNPDFRNDIDELFEYLYAYRSY